MKKQDSDPMQALLEALQSDITAVLRDIEGELAALPPSHVFGELPQRDTLKRAYMIGFARLSLGLGDLEEVLTWLRTLPGNNKSTRMSSHGMTLH